MSRAKKDYEELQKLDAAKLAIVEKDRTKKIFHEATETYEAMECLGFLANRAISIGDDLEIRNLLTGTEVHIPIKKGDLKITLDALRRLMNLYKERL